MSQGRALGRCTLTITFWIIFCIISAQTQAGVYAKQVDDPLNGRLVLIGNEHGEVIIAPQVGGRILGLRPVTGPEFLRSDAGYSQAKDYVACALGNQRRWWNVTQTSAEAQVLRKLPGLVAVQWKSWATSGKIHLLVMRRVVVTNGVPAIFFEASVRNEGKTTAQGVSYQLHLPFILPEVAQFSVINTSTAFSRDQMTDKKFSEAFALGAGGLFQSGKFGVGVHPDHNAHLKLRGGWYLSLDILAKPEDLAPGQSLTTRLTWTFGEGHKPPSFEWGNLPVQGEKVAPLRVSDVPPVDLPRTPVAEQTGYHGVCLQSSREFLPLWAAAGVRWLRTGAFGWARIEPVEGQLDFSETDDLVKDANVMGMNIIALISSVPPWASRDGRFISPPKNLDAWSRYIETVVGRYKGRVSVWEIWNEPDISQFWLGTAEDYVALLKAAYSAAKRADPKCLIMTAGLDGPGEAFLHRIIRMGAADHCDLIGFHPYAGSPEDAEKRLRAVWRILNFYHIRKPVWVTEVGWQSGGWKEGPSVVADEQIKARYPTECFERLRPFAEIVCWYVDMEPGKMYGLARPSGLSGFDLNPAYHAFKSLTAGKARNPLVKLDAPKELTAPAGKTTTALLRVSNTSDRSLPLSIKAVGLSPNEMQCSIRDAVLASKSQTEATIILSPRPYAKAGERMILLTVFADGRLAGEAWIAANIINEEPFYAVSLADGWLRQLDAEGKEISAWRPRSEAAFRPGEAFRQSGWVVNEGSLDETFLLSAAGPAAPWVNGLQGREVLAKSGQKAWFSFDVRVPANVKPGVYSIQVIASSRTHPELKAERKIIFAVGGR